MRVNPREGGDSNLRAESGGEVASEGLIPNSVWSSVWGLLGLRRAARSGSKEPRLKLRLVSCALLKKPPVLGGLLPTSSTTTPSTPFSQSFAANTSFTIMASNTSVVSFDVVRLSADVSSQTKLASGSNTGGRPFVSTEVDCVRRGEVASVPDAGSSS